MVVFQHEKYDQYFISIEQELCMKSADFSMALFLLLASHYIFNLSYQTKVFELMNFLQEKITGISSEGKGTKKMKSPVAAIHVGWISSIYNSFAGKNPNDNRLDENDGHKSDNSE